MRLEGRAFGDVPLNLEYKLEVWDSPNSAGIIIDAVRAAKLAKDRGIGGPILSASSYFMKSPPEQYSDDEARRAVEEFIRGRAGALAPSSVQSRRHRPRSWHPPRPGPLRSAAPIVSIPEYLLHVSVRKHFHPSEPNHGRISGRYRPSWSVPLTLLLL